MIYVIGGPGKSGSTTIGKKLAKDLDIRRIYAGEYMRREALKLGLKIEPEYKLQKNQEKWDLDQADLLAFRDYCHKNHRNIDQEMETYILTEMLKAVHYDRDLVVESKTMPWMLGNSAFKQLANQIVVQNNEVNQSDIEKLLQKTYCVWIHADADVRATRSLLKTEDSQERDKTPTPPNHISKHAIDDELEKLARRQQNDHNAYAKNYGFNHYPLVDDFPSERHFAGPIIDNSKHGSIEETYRAVKEAFKLD